MSTIALRESGADFEPLTSWYRKRPTQLAFAASLLVHAILIAVMPGFRSVPPDTPSVLTVQIVNEAVPSEKSVVPEKTLEPKPLVHKEEAVPEPAKPVELPAPPELAVPAPQPRVIEQTAVAPRPVVTPQPAPVVHQPDLPQVQDVARAELAPVMPQQRPQMKPIMAKQPELAPQQLAVPVIQPQTTARVDEPLAQPVDVRPQPRVVRQAPASVARPQPPTEVPRPDAPVVAVAPAQIQPPVVAAPTAPVKQAAPVLPAQPQASAAVAPPVTAALAKPSAPAPVTAPAPPAPVKPVLAKAAPAGPAVEPVEESVLEAYRQKVSQEVMRHMNYPPMAIRRKWQGKAIVEMQVSDDGSVTKLVVVESSGQEMLDDAALKMIRDSLPLPRPPRGVRAVKVPVVFRLQQG